MTALRVFWGARSNGLATRPGYRIVSKRGVDYFYAFNYPIAMGPRSVPITRPGVLLWRVRWTGENHPYLFKLPSYVKGTIRISAVDEGVFVGHVSGHAREWRFETRSLDFTSVPA